ncbi:MAG: sigma factor-like helix-turn-helix DNA-binding protein, partial [Actinomycetota bacterium]
AMVRLASEPAPDAMQESDIELDEMLAMLAPRQRAAVALHYNLGLGINEVAAAMRCRPGTVKSLLHSAREKLRRELHVDE